MARTTVSHRRLLAIAAPFEKRLQADMAREFAKHGRALLSIVNKPINVQAGGTAARQALSAHKDRMQGIIRKSVSKVFGAFAVETLRQLKVSPTSRQGAAIVSAIRGRASSYADDVMDEITPRTDDWTVGGIASWAADEQADAIRYITERWPGAMGKRRASTIAGNTVHQAASIAQEEASRAIMDDTGEPLYRTWMTRQDSKVRPTHRAMHGLTAGPDEIFTVPRESGGDDDMRYPRDPRGSVENVANCRCFLRYSKTPPKAS